MTTPTMKAVLPPETVESIIRYLNEVYGTTLSLDVAGDQFHVEAGNGLRLVLSDFPIWVDGFMTGVKNEVRGEK